MKIDLRFEQRFIISLTKIVYKLYIKTTISLLGNRHKKGRFYSNCGMVWFLIQFGQRIGTTVALRSGGCCLCSGSCTGSDTPMKTFIALMSSLLMMGAVVAGPIKDTEAGL